MLRGEAYHAFSNKVRSYDPRDLIALVARTSAQRLFDPDSLNAQAAQFFKHPEATFFDFILAAIVKASIEIEPARHIRRDKIPSLQDLGQLQDMFMSCSAEEPMEGLDDFYQFFFRTGHLQFPTQRLPWKQIPRALLLYTSASGLVDDYDPEKAFESLAGISIRDFMFIGNVVVILAQQSEDGQINVDVLMRLPHEVFSKANLDAFFRLTVATESEMRQSILTVVRIPGFEIYEYNPLVERPILRDQYGRLILPVPRYLIDRVTEGLFYDLAEMDDGVFLTYLGKSFERYVGRLFVHHRNAEIHGEREYGSKRSRRKTTDWLIAHDSTAALLECKTKRLKVGSETSQRPYQLADDLKRGVVKAVLQLRSTTEAIRGELVYEEYRHHRLLPLVVLLDSCFLFNADPVRSMVAKETGIGPDDFIYQVASVDEVEDLATLDALSILRVLAEKIDSPETRQSDLSTAVRPQLNDASIHPLLDEMKTEFLESFRPH